MKMATKKTIAASGGEGSPARGDPPPQNLGKPDPGVQQLHDIRQLPVPQSIVNELPCCRWWFEVMFALLESGLPVLKVELENAARRDHVSFARAFVAFYKLRQQAMEIFNKEEGSFHELWKRTCEEMGKAIEGAGTTNVPLTEGIRVQSSNTTRASIKEGQKDKAYAWLRQNGYGDLVSVTVNSSSLSSLAGDLIKENQQLPEQYFNLYYQPVISVTKIKGKNGNGSD